MVIEKELRVFIHANGLSPNQAFFLISLYNKDDKYINNITKDERKNLYDRDLIFNTEVPSLRREGLAIFEDENMKELFNELWDVFPTKTPNGRVLKSVAKNTKQYEVAWGKYKRICKKKEDHKAIMHGLKAELADKARRGSLEYFQGIERYLNARNWEMYQDSEISESTDNLYSTI